MPSKSAVHLTLALGMCAVTFGGFWFTYFGRILGGLAALADVLDPLY